MSRVINFAKAINEAYFQAMETDKSVISFGLGIDDPKSVFGTTSGLKERFGSERVFDMPTSENAMTGVAIGASLNGIRPVMCHQRLDFFLLAIDQLVNNAAKWQYMFGGTSKVPITIRLILGQGWGQGPSHSQNLQSWFVHIPGLKVVMPSSADDAKGLLLSSIFDDNPVVFMEHRWLHNVTGHVPEGDYRIPLGRARLLKSGKDLTIVSYSYMTIESLYAYEALKKNGIECDIIDLRCLKPIDWEMVLDSLNKTGKLLVLDTGNEMCSVAGEIIAKIATEHFSMLKEAPGRLALPDVPSPTSPALSRYYYKRAEDIVTAAGKILGKSFDISEIIEKRKGPHDVPGDWFKGPF